MNASGRRARSRVPGISALLLAGALQTACSPTEDRLAEQGKAVFLRCQSCHAIDERRNKVGPHLVGLFGRQAGSVAGFPYSDTMRESGIVWTEDTLRQYLANPRGYLPGNRMSFAGIGDADDLEALLAYLIEASPAD